MSRIYYSVPGSYSGGGPSVHIARMTDALRKRGHIVSFEKPNRSDIVVAVISVGKLLRSINRDKTRIILRIDGIYNNEYNKKFNRAIRSDMTALHNDLRKFIPLVDHVVYQSRWSYDRIQDEIVKQDKNYSIINNGVDIKLFKPLPRKNDGIINLIHVGKMRDKYLMKTIVGVFKTMKEKNKTTKIAKGIRLSLIGTMDKECAKFICDETNSGSLGDDFERCGSIPNNKLINTFGNGDILLDVRQGASCNNIVPEAQALGIPVITPSWGGGGEMIVDGKTGIIVEGGRWDYNETYIQNLANAVEQIIPNLDVFKNRSREHAVKELNIDKMVNKYLKAMKI